MSSTSSSCGARSTASGWTPSCLEHPGQFRIPVQGVALTRGVGGVFEEVTSEDSCRADAEPQGVTCQPVAVAPLDLQAGMVSGEPGCVTHTGIGEAVGS